MKTSPKPKAASTVRRKKSVDTVDSSISKPVKQKPAKKKNTTAKTVTKKESKRKTKASQPPQAVSDSPSPLDSPPTSNQAGHMISIIDVPNANSDLFVNHNDNLQLTSAQKKPGVGESSTKKASKRKKKLKMMQKRRQKCIAIGVDIDYDSEYDKCVDYDLESLKQYDRLAGSISSDSSVNNVNDFDDLPSNDYTEIDEFSDFDDFKETSSTTRGGSKTCPEGELQKIERRTKVQRRRQIDPTTCERDYTDAEVEFMKALEEYKRSSGRMFPTCSEILEVLLKLGYAKHEMKDESMTEPPMSVEPEQFPTITTPMFTGAVLPTDTIGVNTEPTAERTPLFDNYAMMY